MRPPRGQPTRLRRPWDSPGKNTGVGCHFLLQCMKVKSESEVTQLWPTLCDPMDCSQSGSSIHGIFPGRRTGVGCHCLLTNHPGSKENERPSSHHASTISLPPPPWPTPRQTLARALPAIRNWPAYIQRNLRLFLSAIIFPMCWHPELLPVTNLPLESYQLPSLLHTDALASVPVTGSPWA